MLSVRVLGLRHARVADQLSQLAETSICASPFRVLVEPQGFRVEVLQEHGQAKTLILMERDEDRREIRHEVDAVLRAPEAMSRLSFGHVHSTCSTEPAARAASAPKAQKRCRSLRQLRATYA